MAEVQESILDRIREVGLADAHVNELSSILNDLMHKAGIFAPDDAAPLRKAQIVLSSKLDPEEKRLAMAAAMGLTAHLEFQRNFEVQGIQDFEFGKNEIIFLHPVTGKKIGPFDKKTLGLIHRTRVMMLFPEQRNRSIREKLLRASGHNLRLVPDEKTGSLASKRYERMMTVGVVFKIQCEHWFLGHCKRSLNVIMAAHEKGFFSEWKKSNIHVGAARKYMKDFAAVRHLIAADLAMTWQAKDEDPKAHLEGTFGVAFIPLLASPARFFLMADRYREWAKDAGLIKSKKELWMPEGWRDLVQDVPPLEVGDIASGYDEEIRKFDAFENEYKAEKEWRKD